jgi:hypothetical protein
MNNYQLKLINVSSSVLWSTNVTQEVYSINLKDYSKGIYLLEIFNSIGQMLDVKKIVLQ